MEDYGFYGLLDEKTTWMNMSNFPLYSEVREGKYPDLVEKPLPAPALNISGFFFVKPGAYGNRFYVYDDVYGHDWSDPRSGNHPFQKKDEQTYFYSDKQYKLTYIDKNGQCPPLSTDVSASFTHPPL